MGRLAIGRSSVLTGGLLSIFSLEIAIFGRLMPLRRLLEYKNHKESLERLERKPRVLVFVFAVDVFSALNGPLFYPLWWFPVAFHEK